jgi:hypothetical protein
LGSKKDLADGGNIYCVIGKHKVSFEQEYLKLDQLNKSSVFFSDFSPSTSFFTEHLFWENFQ